MESYEIAELLARHSYFAVFGLLCAAGVGAPVSEDLLLILSGALIGRVGGHLLLMMAVGWAGVVMGDGLLFRIGRGLGTQAMRHRHLSRVLTPARVERVRGYYQRYGMLTVVMVRFVPGLRAATILVSGSSGLKFWKFLVADAAAALVTTPLLIWLGFRFGNAALRDVREAGWVLLAVAVAGLAAFIAVGVVRRLRSRRRLAHTSGEDAARWRKAHGRPG